MNELANIVSRTKLEFMQHSAGDVIAEQDENCTKFIYVLSGNFSAERICKVPSFILTESLTPPHVIEPQNLFGRFQRYQSTYRFDTDGSTLSISRDIFIDFLMNFRIIKLNMLNFMGSKIQHNLNMLREMDMDNPVAKLNRLIKMNSQSMRGEKVLSVKMENLALLLHETRLNVSKMLKDLEGRGLVKLRRGEIYIYDTYELLTCGVSG